MVQLQKFAANSKNEEVQLAKLERMKQYSEAFTCRRRILLSYFGELKKEDCGNCDICRNPPQFFDGTLIAQKALSCIYRLKGNEPITLVIDVLRGSQNEAVLEKNYQHIKTYGMGKEISWRDWQQYLIQLINIGYIEIAFHKHNHLHLTPLAKTVLFENGKVQLALIPDEKEVKVQEEVASGKKDNSLFEKLRQLRLRIAQEEGIPAYLIFNDATLKEMEKQRPMTDDDFMEINGVGRKKMQDYGYQFIKEIISYKKQKPTRKKKAAKGNTYKATLELFNEGLSIEEISEKRGIAPTTVFSHLAKLYDDGEPINMKQFISTEELEAVRKARLELGEPETLKPYFEHFQQAMDYGTIRLALAVLKKED